MSDKGTGSYNTSVTEIVKALGLEDLLDGGYDFQGLPSSGPASLKGVFENILTIAGKFGVEARAEVLVEELSERTEIIRHKLKFVEDRPSVTCISRLAPLGLAGMLIPELVEIAGGIPVLTEKGKEPPYIEFEELKTADPAVIVIAAANSSIEQTLLKINLLLDVPGWYELAAVKNNRVYIADGSRYFNSCGPSLVDTLEILAEIIQPKQFVFGFEGDGWVKFSV